MTEPCDLSAVAARALIGAKKLSARELLDSCIRRMDAIDPAAVSYTHLDVYKRQVLSLPRTANSRENSCWATTVSDRL